MAKVLTAAAVEKTKPGATRQEIPDARMQGLHLVVQPSGAKSWAVRYRLNGRPAKYTLGKYPRVKLGEARTQAGATLDMVARGIDPAAQKQAAQSSAPDTFNKIADEFVKRHVERKSARTHRGVPAADRAIEAPLGRSAGPRDHETGRDRADGRTG